MKWSKINEEIHKNVYFDLKIANFFQLASRFPWPPKAAPGPLCWFIQTFPS